MPEAEELIPAAPLRPEPALVLQQPPFYSSSERNADKQGNDLAEKADQLNAPVIGRVSAVALLVQRDELRIPDHVGHSVFPS